MNLKVWHEPGNTDGDYLVVCDRHSTCIGAESRAAASTICELDFCEEHVAEAEGLPGAWAVEDVDGVPVSLCLSCMTPKPLTAFPTKKGGRRDLRACRVCR